MTRFLYDGDDPILEYMGSGVTTANARRLRDDMRGSVVLATDWSGAAQAIEQANRGLIDANHGGGLIKQRVGVKMEASTSTPDVNLMKHALFRQRRFSQRRSRRSA